MQENVIGLVERNRFIQAVPVMRRGTAGGRAVGGSNPLALTSESVGARHLAMPAAGRTLPPTPPANRRGQPGRLARPRANGRTGQRNNRAPAFQLLPGPRPPTLASTRETAAWRVGSIITRRSPCGRHAPQPDPASHAELPDADPTLRTLDLQAQPRSDVFGGVAPELIHSGEPPTGVGVRTCVRS
jgi:hypothetical protein